MHEKSVFTAKIVVKTLFLVLYVRKYKLKKIVCRNGTETVENATIAQYTYDKFEAGTYMIRVTAVDEAGNKRVMDFFTTVTVQGNIDDGYTGESGESGESNSETLNLVLSGTVADTGDTLKVYLTYPEEATDIRLTAEGAEVELYGRTAEISFDTPGEVDVTLTVTINGEEKSVTRTVRFFDPADNTHPKASFLTPEADSELKTKTEITGTVWDETSLAYYTLEYRMEGTDTFREISSGEEMVEEGILGELDTTLLENGRYLLRLTVVDNGGNRIRVERAINVTGNLKVGNLSLSFTDINANVSGVPLTVIRSYDSRNKTSGDFGTGWRQGLQSVRLTEAKRGER